MGAALVSDEDLPGHVGWWFSCVPLKGGEDVLILCLNPAPLSTQGCVSLCATLAGCLVTGLLNLWQFLSFHALCFFAGSVGILEEGGGRGGGIVIS